MQPNLNQNNCIALEEANVPVCQQCMKKEVEIWLKRRKPQLVPKLQEVTKEFFRISKYTNDQICQLCNKRKSMCDFCFREHIRTWIKEKYPRLLAEFRLFFDRRTVL